MLEYYYVIRFIWRRAGFAGRLNISMRVRPCFADGTGGRLNVRCVRKGLPRIKTILAIIHLLVGVRAGRAPPVLASVHARMPQTLPFVLHKRRQQVPLGIPRMTQYHQYCTAHLNIINPRDGPQVDNLSGNGRALPLSNFVSGSRTAILYGNSNKHSNNQ